MRHTPRAFAAIMFLVLGQGLLRTGAACDHLSGPAEPGMATMAHHDASAQHDAPTPPTPNHRPGPSCLGMLPCVSPAKVDTANPGLAGNPVRSEKQVSNPLILSTRSTAPTNPPPRA